LIELASRVWWCLNRNKSFPRAVFPSNRSQRHWQRLQQLAEEKYLQLHTTKNKPQKYRHFLKSFEEEEHTDAAKLYFNKYA